MAIPDKEHIKINTNEQNVSEESTGLGSKKKYSPFLTGEATAPAVIAPVVKLESVPEKEKTDDLSEESLKDKSIFSSTGKLYFLSTKTNKLETRGEGSFYIFKDKSNMYRLMMIRDQFKLKGCNHYIIPACPLTKAKQLKNSWVWTALQDKSDAEKNEEKTVYFAVFKDEETSDLFEKKYNEAKEANGIVLEEIKTKKEGKDESISDQKESSENGIVEKDTKEKERISDKKEIKRSEEPGDKIKESIAPSNIKEE